MSARLRLSVSGSKSGWLLNATVPRRIPDSNEAQINRENVESLFSSSTDARRYSSTFGTNFRKRGEAKAVCRDVVRRGGEESRKKFLHAFLHARNNKIKSFHGRVYARVCACMWKRFRNKSRSKWEISCLKFLHVRWIDSISFSFDSPRLNERSQHRWIWNVQFNVRRTERMCCAYIPVGGTCPNLSRGLGFGARGNTSAA